MRKPHRFKWRLHTKNTHHLTDVLHPDISKLFMHLRYRQFSPEGTVDESTEQLLKKFKGNSIKNYSDEQH